MRQMLSESCKRSATDAEIVKSAIAEIASRQETLAQQIADLEVFQARFDSCLTAVEGAQQEGHPPPAPDRNLRTAVAGIAFLSALSLAVGLFSIWQ
jgi:hypothetical protein